MSIVGIKGLKGQHSWYATAAGSHYYIKHSDSMYSSVIKPLEVLAIELMQLEPSLDGRENIVVPTDVFAKFTKTVATDDQKASAGVKV